MHGPSSNELFTPKSALKARKMGKSQAKAGRKMRFGHDGRGSKQLICARQYSPGIIQYLTIIIPAGARFMLHA
jgi:hypothetical protein